MTAAIRPPQPLRLPDPASARPGSGDAPLVLIPGGRDAVRRRRRTPAVYRRRRWAAALVATASLFVLLVVVQAVEGRVLSAGAPVSSPRSDPSGAVAVAPGPATTVVVQPGDTAWSIARRLQPAGDIRPLVDRLVEREGGGVLEVGQRLDVGGLTP